MADSPRYGDADLARLAARVGEHLKGSARRIVTGGGIVVNSPCELYSSLFDGRTTLI